MLQALQVLHHLRDVHLAGLVLHIGKPAAPNPNHYGNHQDEVFHPIMLWTWQREGRTGEEVFISENALHLYFIFLATKIKIN